MIKSSVFLNSLIQNKFLNILRVHTITELSFNVYYVMYSLVYIIIAAGLSTSIAFALSVVSGKSLALFFCYLICIGYSSLSLGMLIARIANDKKKAAFLSSVIMICSVFIVLFLMKNSFLLLIMPHLFALHRIMYLDHTTVYEWCNAAIPFLISTAYILIASPQTNKRPLDQSTRTENNLFAYKDTKDIDVTYVSEEKHVSVGANVDLSVKDLVVDIGSRRIINCISFEVTKQQVFGLLGLSGSGKSVTL